PLLEAGALGQAVEHGGERRAVLGISGKHLVGDRKALAADDQPDDDLLAVRSMIARIAPLGLGIADTLTLEVGRGQIVEIDRRIEVEQAALALNQRRLDAQSVDRALLRARHAGLDPAYSARRHSRRRLRGVMAQARSRAAADSLQSRRMSSSPRRRQNWWPTWTGPASRWRSVVTRVGSTLINPPLDPCGGAGSVSSLTPRSP